MHTHTSHERSRSLRRLDESHGQLNYDRPSPKVALRTSNHAMTRYPAIWKPCILLPSLTEARNRIDSEKNHCGGWGRTRTSTVPVATLLRLSAWVSRAVDRELPCVLQLACGEYPVPGTCLGDRVPRGNDDATVQEIQIMQKYK